jgi:hypothetical protein
MVPSVLLVEVDKSAAALIGLVRCRELSGSYFCRLSFSAGEMDKTRRPGGEALPGLAFRLRLALA